MGLKGGTYGEIYKEAEAIITEQRPIPLRKWETPIEYRINSLKNEERKYEYTIREFSGDQGDSIYFVEIKFSFYRDGFFYASGTCEFFVEEDYVEQKVEELRQNNLVAIYDWIPDVPTWHVVEHNFENDIFEWHENEEENRIE
ncbi:hypothetical protein KHA96_17365 [Bacillus sp. FJAT-49711]|uniref:hypothetical protein n=1 Tax=Bacillus sp. FJAT-49711 TaxID=2833585 RepID=UPI001BC90E13|nr:hypothetical protein [Bacillus sp. FJAT-49711]MBS4220084.1 hypothetical protein [Bacillus sp. FJAT-49711]